MYTIRRNLRSRCHRQGNRCCHRRKTLDELLHPSRCRWRCRRNQINVNTLWCFVTRKFLISVPGLSRHVRYTNGVRRDIPRPADPSDDKSKLRQIEGEASAAGEAGVSYLCTHRTRRDSDRASGAAKRGNERSSGKEAAQRPYPCGRATASVDDSEVTATTDADAGDRRRDILGWEDWVGSQLRLRPGTSGGIRETSDRPRRICSVGNSKKCPESSHICVPEGGMGARPSKNTIPEPHSPSKCENSCSAAVASSQPFETTMASNTCRY